MKKGLTEMVFILDRSGSMGGLEKDTIGGFNSLIEKQKKEEGEALVSTVLFDNYQEVLHDRIPLDKIGRMTEEEYYVRGCTALLDAIGGAINHIGNIHKYAREEDVPEKTIFVITTDGLENASSRYSYRDVKKMIKRQEEKYGWEFLFLGANIDVAKESDRLGIRADRAVRYVNDSEGVELNYAAVGCAVSALRSMKNTAEFDGSWKKSIEKDFKNAGYKATRRGKFKEEFWDNNLKGHLPFVGKWSDGRWKKNLVMLGGESLGGFALGSAFAAKLGLSLAGGILPAIGAAAVILVTAIAIAVLVSLIITLVKGFKDLKNNDGFYKPTQNDQASAKTSQTVYLNRIYTAFLTFGADEEKLKPLVKDSKAPEKSKRREFDNSSRGKFFKSMMKMKDFLKEHATGDLQKSLKDSKPFQILEGKNQEPPRNEHNENNNNEPVGH